VTTLQSALARPERHQAIDTDIPARLDRLPWTRFHWFLVTALGITWVLDGLEATVVAAISPVLLRPTTLGLNAGRSAWPAPSTWPGPSAGPSCSATSPTGWAASAYSR
jgi:hypothetical protein